MQNESEIIPDKLSNDELKLELHKIIDNIIENQKLRFYYIFITNCEK
jgi:hypothetical protein|nr:MAG TPA_asm: hypothetical protein [Caudoviricetes sp.]